MSSPTLNEFLSLAKTVQELTETVDRMATAISGQLASLQAELIIIRDDLATMRSGHAAICQQLRAHTESLVVLHGYHV